MYNASTKFQVSIVLATLKTRYWKHATLLENTLAPRGDFFWKPGITMCFQDKIYMSMTGTGNHNIYNMAALADDAFNKEFLKINCLVVS